MGSEEPGHGRIRRLDDAVANQIAAGEVVERPASVVKELVENALDAEATRIRVEVEEGGLRRIKITDDGHGMGRGDAVLCLERHATSKIRRVEDLDLVRTLGFRGEAVPSIASVSRFTLTTREPQADVGTRVTVEGGGAAQVADVGAPPGTTVEVSDLFFNVPARKKFLKRPATELAHISEQLVRLAMCRPEVGFKLITEHKTLLDVPPGTASDPKGRLGRILGPEVAERLHAIPDDGRAHAVDVRGFVAEPGLSERGTKGLYTFVNGRFVRDRTIQHALQDAYRTLLERGRYPVVVLFIEVDPASYDVNVHPQKIEVRFARTGDIHRAVAAAVSRGLEAQPGLHRRGPAFAPAPPAPLHPARGHGAGWASAGPEGEGWGGSAGPGPLASEARSGPEGRGEGWAGSAGPGPHGLPSEARSGPEGRGEGWGGSAGPGPLASEARSGPEGRGEGWAGSAGPGPHGLPSEARSGPEGRGEGWGGSAGKGPHGFARSGPEGRGEGWGGSAGKGAGRFVPELDLSRALGGASAARDEAAAPYRPELPGRRMSSSLVAQAGFRFQDLLPVGQVLGTYLVCQAADRVVLIDQHAAHERITFQRLRTQRRAEALEVQPLLLPLELTLDPRRDALARDMASGLADVGINLELGEDERWRVKSCPVALRDAPLERMVLDLLDELGDLPESTAMEDYLDALFSCAACHTSVRAGDRLQPAEIRALLVQMDEIDFGAYCPHGRPVFVEWSAADLARLFHRA